MPKIIIVLLLLANTSKVFATGIMPPAGFGYIPLVMLIIFGVGILITIFSIRIIYKNSNNKPKTKKNIKRFFIVQFLLGLFVYYVWIPGYVSFTRYTIIDNNPLEAVLEIKLQHGFYYFELSDGNSYEFKKKYGDSYKRSNSQLDVGQLVMLTEANSNEYTLNSIGNTGEYYRYLRVTNKVVLTIPFSFKKIIKNQKKYEGTIYRVTDKWIANQRNLVLALDGDYCCDLPWIKKLLKQQVNKSQIINKRKLLHRIFSLKNQDYQQYRTEVLGLLFAEPRVNVNQRGYSNETILHQAIRKISNTSNNELSQSDREFIQLLLNAGVNQNLADNRFATPLIATINENKFQLAHFLLDNGAYFARRYSNRESAREIIRRKIKRSKANKHSNQDRQTQLISLLEAMDKKLRNKQRPVSKQAKNRTKSLFPVFSEIIQDCNVLGSSWEKAYGIKVDQLADLSSLTEQEKKQIKSIQNKFKGLAITALADYTCNKKRTPLNTVTIKVFVFENTKRALNWWKKKYQYKGWKKHYTKNIDTPYLAIDSKQLTKRAILFNNLWITTHHIQDGKEHLILLDDLLNKVKE